MYFKLLKIKIIVNLINKILTVFWYIKHPKYHLHFFSLIIRKFSKNYDTIENRRISYDWCKNKSIPYKDVFKKIGIKVNLEGLSQKLITQGLERQKKNSN